MTTVFAVLGTVQQREAKAASWNLVWSDEFNGNGAPNSGDWNYNVGNGRNPGLNAFDGWGNGEWEWYRPENCTQSGGNLNLRADWLDSPMVIDGRNWFQRSCRLTTDQHRSFTYGRIEARIAMPNANGSWPAFWLLGDACDETSTNSYNPDQSYSDVLPTNWASCGEVDIMEHKNSDQTVVNNIFWDTRTGLFPWTAGMNANYVTTANSGNVANFNVYAIEWDASYIRWFINGTQTHEIDIRPASLEEFHKPMHVIMNMALGGSFPAMSPEKSQFPLNTQVDYVRVYQDGGTTTTPPPPPPTPAPGSASISAPGGKCVDVAGDDNGGNGAAVQIWDCQSAAADQKWAWNGTSVRTLGRCLDVTDSSTANGAKLQLWDCTGGPAQQWQQVGNTLRNIASGRCVDSPNGATANGTRLQIWDCNGSGAQTFVVGGSGATTTPTPPPPPASSATQINGPGGKCIDVAGDDLGGNGAAVQLWTCLGGAAADQQWTWNGTSLRTLGRCLDVSNAGTANGAKLQLWDCNDGGAQQWQQNGSTLRNPASGKCIDSPSGSTANGARLQIWDCNGTGAQSFVKAA